MFSLSTQTECGESAYCGLVVTLDANPQKVGFWPLLSVLTQRQGVQMEPQAHLSHIQRARAESPNQTQETNHTHVSKPFERADRDEPGVVDGLYE